MSHEVRYIRSPAQAGKQGRLGTFAGVFTPSILTILGIILFLRLGFVVGDAGLARAFVILAVATVISVLTSLSLAAIATNRKVRAGGDYYLISRSLGVEFGGALGLVLFAAQAISIAFYCVGFGEAIGALLPDVPNAAALAAAGAGLVLLAIAFVGADLATRLQFGVMAVLFAALVSVFVGGALRFDADRLAANWAAPAEGLPFWTLFAIFFPAVTGFTQGVSMSGELREPRRSLPRGTFLAVGLSTLVYVALMLLLAGAAPAGELARDYGVMRRIARYGWLVDAGVLAATLSSALASFLGAPRILQAVASDRIFNVLTPFAVTAPKTGNPRRAVLLTGAIAFATLALGQLNTIARLVSMFFLISYGLLNYATYVEATGASPSFRPRFRFFHARVSLAGTLCCGGVMLAIDPVASVVALAILAAAYQYVRRTAVPFRWRDSWPAYRLRRVKEWMLELANGGGGERDWQPHILVFTEDPRRRTRLLRFASWIGGGTGITAAVQLIAGDGTRFGARAQCTEAEQALRAELLEARIDAFPLAVAATNLPLGAATLVQAWGIGPIRANTILLNWVERFGIVGQAEPSDAYVQLLRGALQLDRHVVVLDAEPDEFEQVERLAPEKRRVDVWWWNDASSNLALMLAYLMTRGEPWDEAPVRLLVPAAADDAERVAETVQKRLRDIRIDADAEVVVAADADAVLARSRESALVFLPLRFAGARIVDPFGGDVDELVRALPVVALVGAAADIKLVEEEPEEAAPPAADAEPAAAAAAAPDES